MMNIYKQILGVSLLAATLIACGGDDSGGETTSPPSQKVDAVLAPLVQDQFEQMILSEENRTVSLKNGVSDPQGLPVTLTGVESITDSCDDPAFDAEAMTFTVDKNAPDVCYYNYTVTNQAPQAENSMSATANSYVLLSFSVTSGSLDPISKTAMEGDDVTIDLDAELGTAIIGYVLDNETPVLGSGSASADSTTNVIIYSAVGKGVSRVLYSLENSSGDIKVGYIDIAVSGDGNGMPVADNFAGPQDLTPATLFTIDVKNYISDPDGDTLQLTDVYAYNATVASANPADIDNTEFSFEATEPGIYDVSYYISDHRGGWAVATVHITVKGPDKPWDDITLPDNEFYTAPWEQVSADGYNIAYTSLETETIGGRDYSISLFTYDSAASLCRLQGMELPSEGQLQKLYTERGNVKSSDSWPIGTFYWTGTANGNNYVAVDLSNGAMAYTSSNQPLIVTCVYQGALTATIETDNAYSTPDATSTGNTVNTVKALVTGKDGSGVAAAYVYAYSNNPDIILSPSMQSTDASGEALFAVRSSSAGTYNVTISYLSQSNEVDLTYRQDTVSTIALTGPSDLIEGETAQYTAETTYVSGNVLSNPDVIQWSTDDQKVATITNNGSLTAVAPGTTNVKALDTDSGASDITSLTVLPEVIDLKNEPVSISIRETDVVQLKIIATYADATEADVTGMAEFVSQQPSVAEVTAKGEVTGISIGVTSIQVIYAGASTLVPVAVGSSWVDTTGDWAIYSNSDCRSYTTIKFTDGVPSASPGGTCGSRVNVRMNDALWLAVYLTMDGGSGEPDPGNLTQSGDGAIQKIWMTNRVPPTSSTAVGMKCIEAGSVSFVLQGVAGSVMCL